MSKEKTVKKAKRKNVPKKAATLKDADLLKLKKEATEKKKLAKSSN